MKLISYRRDGTDSVGLLDGEKVEHLATPTLLALLSERPLALSLTEHIETQRTGVQIDLRDVQVIALTCPRRNVFAVGWNYTDHFDEGAAARNDDRPLPEYPTFFTKTPESIVGPEDVIVIDSAVSARWDYEAEIAIVIGLGGRGITLEQAPGCVAGFALANDVTARDVQRRHGGQWFKGKSMDQTCPLGPVLVTPDELPDARPSSIELTLNGVLRQSAMTADMYFDFGRLISELSRGLELLPGDVILTGTPSGVGYARQPPVWLTAGDEVIVSSPGLGELRNTVVNRTAGA